jgi:hypothetical protein
LTDFSQILQALAAWRRGMARAGEQAYPRLSRLGGPAMRHALAAALLASLFSTAAMASPPVMPTTPIGYGDPNTTVCRAPQKMGSGQLGPQACGTNAEWYRLAMNGKDLAADGKTVIDRPTVGNPRGEGDPDALTCRTPTAGSQGAVCRTNRFWANLIKNHKALDAGDWLETAPRQGYDPGWATLPGHVGFTSAGGDTGMQQPGMPIHSFRPN